MTQTRKRSMIEVICNVGSGFIVSLLVWEFIVEPLWGIDKAFMANIGITSLFTCVSILRGFVWRRAFDAIERRITK